MKELVIYFKHVLLGFFVGMMLSLIILSVYQLKVINTYSKMIDFTTKEMEIMKRMTSVSLMADPQKNFRDSRFEDRLALYEYITNK